jgi:subfamily B ATP-binding cassette protein MsbA
MKTYFRLLSFAKPIEKFAIPYFLLTLLFVIFNTLVFALLGPTLQILFSDPTAKGAAKVITHLPDFSFSINYFSNLFNYYLHLFILEKGPKGALSFVSISLVICVFLSNFFRYFSQRIMEDLRVHSLQNLRQTVYNNVVNLHIGFFSNERKGDIISKITADVQVVQFCITNTLQVVFKEPLLIIGYLVLLFNISPQLTLFSLLVIPVSGLFIAAIVKKLRAQAVEAQQSFGLLLSFLDETLSGIRIVNAFNAIPIVQKRFADENRKYSNLNRSMARRQQLASPVSEFLGVLTLSGILLYGGSLVLDNSSALTAGNFIAYLGAFSQLLRPAKAITDSFSNINQGLAAGERVLDLIDTKTEIIQNPAAVEIYGLNKGIRFENVSFSYTDRVVLNGISVTIPTGKTVALVGPSGGGKSTLMDIIPRFIEPDSGSIFFDDVNIQDINLKSLRSQMGIVNQESILFNDTIFHNIAFGRPDATQEEVETAAKIANAHEFILQTDEGYETNIGDRGMKLSGGQKQRLCIARAVLSNPPLMLLDEATSALDTESEKLVQDALNNLMKNRTSLIIAHRLSTIQNADHIIVLEAGKVVEEGTHQKLLAKDGLYKRLIDMQTFS